MNFGFEGNNIKDGTDPRVRKDDNTECEDEKRETGMKHAQHGEFGHFLLTNFNKKLFCLIFNILKQVFT